MTRRRELRTYSRADLIPAVRRSRPFLKSCASFPRSRHGDPLMCTWCVRWSRTSMSARRNSLVFVGGFAHRPNVDGMLFFCREVFPLVQRVLP